MGDCLQKAKPSWYITSNKVNSTFHAFGVGKPRNSLWGWSQDGAHSPTSSGR